MTESEHKTVAVVTGAGSGIGRAVALKLVEHGYHVYLTGRHQHSLEQTASLAEAYSNHVTAFVTDVTQQESVDSLFKHIEKNFGRIDLLFNNAGVSLPALEVDEVSINDWNRLLSVNLTGVFLCSRAAFALMKRQKPGGGRIINNGSISSTTPRPLSAAYTATKHAVTGLTKSLALDGRTYGITCGQIDIGNADTAIAKRIKEGILQSDGSIRAEPTIDVECVAEAVLTMAKMPPNANVFQMTVMAAQMPFVGRG
ncbi:MAG: SDR family oxidoreductase [Rubripirellula sp.]|nr:SDR family oxidoreductase [Rubripirellula sp.]